MENLSNYNLYIHRVVTDDNGPMYYVGVTINPKQRWYASCYNETALKPYIDKYGWDNIRHSLVAEGLDRETALKLEDTLIEMFSAFQCCINKHRSGLIANDKNVYNRQWYANNGEWVERYNQRRRDRHANDQEYAERRRQQDRDKYANDQEYAERRRQYERERRANDPELAERQRQYQRNKRATTEGRIYDRVKAFNQRHPDRIVETPLEAKKRYLEQHIIPDYIKNNDLK